MAGAEAELNHELEFLEALCAAPGIAGHEEQVIGLVQDRLAARGVEAAVDRLGNLTARFAGPRPRLLLLAHADEVGFIVRKIRADGFLSLERVGGASVQALPGQRLEVWTEAGALPGVVGVLPHHLAGDAPPGLAQVYVDVGARSKDEASSLGVEVGNPITYRPVWQTLNGRLSAKALDDRLGCFLLVRLAESLIEQPPPCEVILAFVVQEETRLRGAAPVTFGVEPDWAVGLDGTLAFDTPDLAEGQTDVHLGGGPAIKIMDHVRGQGQGMISHLGLRRHIEAIAKENGIPLQREIVVGLTTAASPLPFVRAGLPVAAISFPLRYSHSPVEVADLSDAEATLRLLEGIVRQPWKG